MHVLSIDYYGLNYIQKIRIKITRRVVGRLGVCGQRCASAPLSRGHLPGEHSVSRALKFKCFDIRVNVVSLILSIKPPFMAVLL